MSLVLEHLPADVLGLSPLARAVLSGRPRPSATPGLCVPASLDDLPRPAERFEADERDELAATLEAALTRFEPHVAVLESVRSLREPGAAMILVGQQPGLFGGPLFNLWKAIHAIRLARAASEAWGSRVIPAFWNHADDHDVAEVHHVWVQNEHLDLQKISLAGMSSGRIPLGAITFEEERHRLKATRELLALHLGANPGGVATLERMAPRAGETFASSFTRLFLDLFGAHGLLVLDPSWIRTRLSRALAQVVGVGPRPLLEEGVRAMRAAGSEPGIDPSRAALVFHHIDGERQALRFADDGFRYDDEAGSRTPAELAAEIVQSPGQWSAGALLRPLVQDLALPVAAYVGGWGELAYHAELPPLRAAAQAPATPFVPRLAVTLVEEEVRDSLATLETSVQAVLQAQAIPSAEGEPEEAPIVGSLRAIAERTRAQLHELEPELGSLDKSLLNQLRRAAKDTEKILGKLSGKIERVHANQKGRGRRHVRRVETALVPRGEPQERIRSALEVFARHGTDWLEPLLEGIDPLPTEHLVVHLSAGDASPSPSPGERA